MDNFNVWQAIFVIIVPAIIAGLPALLGALKARKLAISEKITMDASAAKTISEAYDPLVESWQARVVTLEEKQAKMESKLDRQGRRIRYLEHGIFVLINQVKSLGAEPAFNLEDDQKEE